MYNILHDLHLRHSFALGVRGGLIVLVEPSIPAAGLSHRFEGGLVSVSCAQSFFSGVNADGLFQVRDPCSKRFTWFAAAFHEIGRDGVLNKYHDFVQICALLAILSIGCLVRLKSKLEKLRVLLPSLETYKAARMERSELRWSRRRQFRDSPLARML